MSNIVLLESLPLSHLQWNSVKREHLDTYNNLLDRFVGELVDEQALAGQR